MCAFFRGKSCADVSSSTRSPANIIYFHGYGTAKSVACTKHLSDELSASGRWLAIATTSDIIAYRRGEAYRCTSSNSGKHIGVRLPIMQAAPVECNRSLDWRWAQLIPTISLDTNSTLHYVFYVSSWCTMVGNPSLTQFNTKSLPFATARSQFLCNSPNFWTRRSALMRASLFTMGYHGYYHYSVSWRPKTSNMQKLVGFGAL